MLLRGCGFNAVTHGNEEEISFANNGILNSIGELIIMANLPIITVGSVTFNPVSYPDGPFDIAQWRDTNAAVPPMYRSTVEHKASLNQPGTNVNETITVKVPELKEIDGVWTVLNTHVASARVAALQNTVDVVSSALALDALIKVLTDRREQILAGSTI